LQANGQAVSSVVLPPHLFNTADLALLLTPDVDATTGDYPVTVTAVPQGNPVAAVTITGTVQVLNRGVQVEILSGPSSLDPRQVGIWDVRVTNTGQAADTFDLQAAGLMALAGHFATDPVTLGPGVSQTVQMTSSTPAMLPPQSYPVVVAATSQADDRIRSQDETTVTITAYEGIEAAWLPATLTVSGTLEAAFTLVVTNTGNIDSDVTLSASATPKADVRLATKNLALPPGAAAYLGVPVGVASGAPMYSKPSPHRPAAAPAPVRWQR
jgi:uncharacterized membrane protein